jgi:glycerophosphoryl diester phosphodiesterase
MIVESVLTASPPYVYNVSDIDPTTGNDPQYEIIPLITVGDEVPLLEGEFGEFTPSNNSTYAMSGTPDGLGYTEINGLRYVFMNHEFSEDVTTQISSTVDGVINGARVSLFIFDEDWNIIGGKNLIETVHADGNSYILNPDTGNYELESDSEQFLNMNDHGNFTRFCSGYLASEGFYNAQGEEVPFWFAPEESTASADESAGGGGLVIDTAARSRGWAVSANGTAYALDGLGIYAKEQVYSPSQWRPANSDVTVLFATEDFGDGELYMYVGKQTPDNPNGFWGSDNPGQFDLYVLRVTNSEGEVFGYETMPENQDLTAQWVPIPDNVVLPQAGDVGYDTQERLSNWVNDIDQEGNFRSTNFRRLEDLHEDPNNPNTFYFVTTGRNDIPEGDDEPDNNAGKLYRITLNVNEEGLPIADADFDFLLEGGLETGVSYDNLVVDSNGNVVLQEDKTAAGDIIMPGQKRYGRILSYNINYNEDKITSDRTVDLFEINQAAEGIKWTGDYGDWESSGIVEVDHQALLGANGSYQSSYLFDIQAHTIDNYSGVFAGQYQEGGQLLLAQPLETSNISY